MGLSCLIESSAPVIADASTVINLVASGRAAAILRALPNPALITDVVMAEVEEGRWVGRRDADLVAELAASSLLTLVSLSTEQELHFESLVVGPSVDTLDDGEAATIAYAAETGATPLIDERKAIRICRERLPMIRPGCTVDLLAHPAVEAALGKVDLADAIFAALQQARMRVLPQHLTWVVELIGPDRARQCLSLPRAARTVAGMKKGTSKVS